MFKLGYGLLAGVLMLGLLGTGCSGTRLMRQSSLDTPANHVSQGWKEFERGNLTQAKLEFQRAKDLDRKFGEAYAGQALASERLGQRDEARGHMKRALKYGRRSLEVAIAQGRLITMQKTQSDWLEKASAVFRKAQKRHPGSDKLLYYWANSYREALELGQAASLYRRVLDGNSEYRDEADAAWATLQKIERAAPGTRVGTEIALAPALTRAELAVLLVEELRLTELLRAPAPAAEAPGFVPPATERAMGAPATAPEKTPSDLGGHWAQHWVHDAIGWQVMEVCPDLKFYPDEAITRAEYAMVMQAVILRLTRDLALAGKYCGERSRFPDLNSTAPAYNAAALCVDRGILKAGTMDGAFEPQQPISGADALLAIRELQNTVRKGW